LSPGHIRAPAIKTQILVIQITTGINAVTKTVVLKKLMLPKGVVVPSEIIVLIIGISQTELIREKGLIGTGMNQFQVGP
jgi:hypothetical protein